MKVFPKITRAEQGEDEDLNIGLAQGISAMLREPIMGPAGDQAEEDFGGIYLAIKRARAGVNAAYEKAAGIDPDVPGNLRFERQRALILDAEAEYKKAMVEPMQQLETELAGKVKRVQDEMAEASKVGDPILAELRAQETRRIFDGMSEADQATQLLKAADTGNVTLFDAVDNAPFGVVKNPDTLERARFEYQDKFFPTLYQQKNRNKQVLDTARAKVNLISHAMRQAFNIPLSDRGTRSMKPVVTRNGKVVS